MVPDIVIVASDTPEKRELCTRIGSIPRLPVIALPMLGDQNEELVMLGAGVDECMNSPVHAVELVARAHSLLRRYRKPYSERISLNPEKKEIETKERVTSLSPTQFRLFACMVLNEGRIMPYYQIISEVWGGNLSLNTLHFHMRRLRQKLKGDAMGSYRIFQSRGEGYYFARGEAVINHGNLR